MRGNLCNCAWIQCEMSWFKWSSWLVPEPWWSARLANAYVTSRIGYENQHLTSVDFARRSRFGSVSRSSGLASEAPPGLVTECQAPAATPWHRSTLLKSTSSSNLRVDLLFFTGVFQFAQAGNRSRHTSASKSTSACESLGSGVSSTCKLQRSISERMPRREAPPFTRA